MRPQVATPADASELLRCVELTGIRSYALAGRRADADEASAEVAPEVAIRLSPTQMEVRMRVEVSTSAAVLEADMAAVYDLTTPANLWAHVVYEFVERVAVMAIYPFVRESVFATASRMGVAPPVLGMMRAGEFSIGHPDGPVFAASRTPASLAELAREFGVPSASVAELSRELGFDPSSTRTVLNAESAAAIRTAFFSREVLGDG